MDDCGDDGYGDFCYGDFYDFEKPEQCCEYSLALANAKFYNEVFDHSESKNYETCSFCMHENPEGKPKPIPKLAPIRSGQPAYRYRYTRVPKGKDPFIHLKECSHCHYPLGPDKKCSFQCRLSGYGSLPNFSSTRK